jgi:putative NADH-flavin reductase
MQTILGAGGSIGESLAKELSPYITDLRLVGRNSYKINPGDQLFSANLLDFPKVSEAVKGAEVVYLTVGLSYKASLWERMDLLHLTGQHFLLRN